MQLAISFLSAFSNMSCVNFDVCSIAFVMYLLDGVHLSIFILIRDYYTPLSLDRFPNASTLLLSLSFDFLVFASKIATGFRL